MGNLEMLTIAEKLERCASVKITYFNGEEELIDPNELRRGIRSLLKTLGGLRTAPPKPTAIARTGDATRKS